DYVLTNFDELDVRVHHIPKITDHSVISVNFCKNKAFLGTNIVKAFRNFSTLKMHDINLELINTDFLLNSTDVNILYDNIHMICETVINNISPIQTYSIREDSVPWYDFEVKNKSKQRDVAHQSFINNRNEVNWQIYRNYRNEVQLLEYLNDNDILIANQSGFRTKHSCETALQLTISKWKKAMDRGDYTIAVFLDLKRAFEMID
ncbi:hypothetical protein NQ318_008403, partial [Aromia moschata]